MRGNALARTPARHHHREVVVAMDEVLRAMEVAEVCRAREGRPLERRHVHAAKEVEDDRRVDSGLEPRCRDGRGGRWRQRQLGAEPAEGGAEVAQRGRWRQARWPEERLGDGGYRVQRRRVDTDHGCPLRGRACRGEDQTILEWWRIDVQRHSDLLIVGVADSVESERVVGKGDALGWLFGIHDNLALHLRVRTRAIRSPIKAFLLQPPLQHPDEAMRT
mmetsp:Transcript_124183/g.310418  ORF Transcript_124183/g.310418 Transcript_124183/m.310418 type:complete len:219 (-) Transcript_124183:590-1246(-)